MNIYEISTYSIKEDEAFFLDCNVLMYLCYPNGSYRSTDVHDYSTFVSKIIESGATIYITDVLLSEFVNTYIKAEFKRLASLNGWSPTNAFFKHTFRATRDYELTLREIRIIIERSILPISKRLNCAFDKTDISALFASPSTFDFNDRYYSQEMAKLGVSIVTNDSDFIDMTGCKILTKNSQLLSSVTH